MRRVTRVGHYFQTKDIITKRSLLLHVIIATMLQKLLLAAKRLTAVSVFYVVFSEGYAREVCRRSKQADAIVLPGQVQC